MTEGAAGAGMNLSPLVFVAPSSCRTTVRRSRPVRRSPTSTAMCGSDIGHAFWFVRRPDLRRRQPQGRAGRSHQGSSGRTIVGFGKGGVVYMMARDDKAAWLERTKR